MVNKIKNKKGELTTQQIAVIIIAILSFSIILFLLFRLNLKETSDQQICYNSVVLKSKGGLAGGKLDCRTNDVCISGGEECSSGSVVKVNANSKNEILKVIADEMADCWWMFGEGKINYAVGSTEVSCARCSIINFDSVILEKGYEINYREFYEYLNSINKTEGQTYFNYLYGFYNLESFQESSNLKIDLDADFVLSGEEYAIITGMKDFFGVTYLPPYYVVSRQASSKLEPSCDNYVTKV